MAFIFQSVMLVLECVGLIRRPGRFEWKMFAFYTQLSNAAAFAASLLFLLLRGGLPAVYMRYLTTCMLLMTVFVTLCILVPMGAGFRKMMLSGNGLYHHTLCPAVSLISYLFFEPHVKAWLFPALVTLGYGLIMMGLNGLGKTEGPYPFFQVKKQGALKSVLWTAALFAAISGISFLVALAA